MNLGRPVVSWWRTRAVRTRLVILSIVPLTVALLVATVMVIVIFSARRTHDLDAQTHAEADIVAGLARNDQLGSPLPVPAGSSLLAQVIAGDGTVLAASPSASLVLALTRPDPALRVARDSTDEENPYGSVPLRLHTQPETLRGQRVLVVVGAPLADVRRARQSLMLVLLLLVPALIAVVAVLEWIVIGSTLRPVERLRAAAAALADPSIHRLIAPTNPPSGTEPEPAPLLPVGSGDDEITRLGRTLNQLLGRLNQALARQRSFLADAAHELRSPLASIRVQLDVAASHPSSVTIPQLVAELGVEVDRLSRLTADLLLLGRLEAGLAMRRGPINLTELASASGPPVTVIGDPDDLERLVRNVTDNARTHATTVRTTVTERDGVAILDIDDDGPGIPDADRARVFERWTRLDTARDRGAGGSGLGLALVREIAAAHAGQVAIQDSPLGGTRFELRMPTAPPRPDSAEEDRR